MARHSGHRVALGAQLCNALGDIHNRILGYHAFVHSVEGNGVALWRPEDAPLNAKLVTVNRFTVHNTLATVGSNLHGSRTIRKVEVIANGIGSHSVRWCKRKVLRILRSNNATFNLLRHQIVASSAIVT